LVQSIIVWVVEEECNGRKENWFMQFAPLQLFWT
jgi:hypothetical protein